MSPPCHPAGAHLAARFLVIPAPANVLPSVLPQTNNISIHCQRAILTLKERAMTRPLPLRGSARTEGPWRRCNKGARAPARGPEPPPVSPVADRPTALWGRAATGDQTMTDNHRTFALCAKSVSVLGPAPRNGTRVLAQFRRPSARALTVVCLRRNATERKIYRMLL